MSTSAIIQARNVNDAMGLGLQYLLDDGIEMSSRNGAVLVAPGPVITEYENPCERVLFSLVRNANPFFHLMESLWMLGGRHDIKFPRYFNSKFGTYSDDGETQHGAYGRRWRSWFGRDQLAWIIKELTENPNSRRAVLGMWDPAKDIDMVLANGVDVPCNTHAYFSICGGKLDMTVCCRSNDVIWGAYGANAVHFSMLMEYVARFIGVAVGKYRQLSNNFHVYTNLFPRAAIKAMAEEAAATNYYAIEAPIKATPLPIAEATTERAGWDLDLLDFLAGHQPKLADDFFTQVAWPMKRAWDERRQGLGTGLAHARAIEATDWRLACVQWIEQADRRKNHAAA